MIKLREIQLRSGNVLLVDDDMYSFFKDRTITEDRNGYLSFSYLGKTELVHRFITQCSSNEEVDHKDLNKCNNQRDNLRLCTRQENMRNRGGFKNSTSKYKGVYYNEKKGWYEVKIRTPESSTKNRSKYLGTFTNEDAGANCYNYFAKQYFGEFAFLNDCPFMNVDEWESYRNAKRGRYKKCQ